MKKMKKAFYIIPCSVHEIILLPDDGIYGAKDLEKMLCEINETIHTENEKLSQESGIRIE